MTALRTFCFGMVFSFISLAAFIADADIVYYKLDNVILDDGTQMTGTFSWIYDVGDFENGVGEFVSLSIPHTSHNQDDLNATFDIGSSIEITLDDSTHDDGVDITLFITNALTPTTSSLVDLNRSKYEIGGNGFHDGVFTNGVISPVSLILNISNAVSGFVTLSWEPDITGVVLQETADIILPAWTNSISGSTNPVVIPTAAPATFFRLVKP